MASREIEGFGKSLGGLGGVGKLATAAVATVATGAVALGAGLIGSVNQATAFEKVISQVGAVSGATAPQLQSLSALALQMGADTAFSASEAAQAMAELAKGGIAVGDMAAVLPGVLDLAAAGGLTLAESATIATDTMAIFAKQGVSMEQVANAFAGAANISSISVSDMAESMKYIGPISNAMGISLEDTSAAIALLGANGLKGSQAGTGLRTMLTSLASPSKEAATLIKDLGLQFFDSTGKVKDFAGISDELKGALKGMTDQQRLATLETLFGKEGMSAAIAIMGEGENSIQSYTAKLANAATAHATGKAMMDNFAGSMDAFKGSIETAAITLGLLLLPYLRQLVDGATSAVNAAVPLIQAYGPGLAAAIASGIGRAITIVQSFGTAIMAVFRAIGSGDFNSAFGPILQAIDTAFGGDAMGRVTLFVSNLLTGMQTARNAVITAKQAFSGEWVSSEAIAAPIRIIGEVFAKLGDVARALADPMSFLRLQIFNLSTAFPQLSGYILPLIGMLDRFGPTVAAAAAGFMALGPALTIAGAALPMLVGAFTGLGPVISFLTSSLPLLGSVIAAVGFPITALVVGVGLLAAAWATNFLGIQTATMPILTAIGAYITGTFLPALTQMGTFLMTNVVPAFVAGWAMIQAGVSTALAAIMPYVTQFIGFLTGQLLPGIQGIIAVAVPAFQQFAAGAMGAFQAALPGLQAFVAGVMAMGAAVLPIIGEIAGMIMGSLGPAVMAVVDWAQTMIPQLGAAWENVWGVIGPVVGEIASVIGSTLTTIAGFISSHKEQIVTILQSAWNIISTVIGTAFALVTGIISAGLQLISGDWKGAWETIKATAQTVWDGIQTVITNAITLVKTQITIALDAIKLVASSAWTAIETAATTGWATVVTAVTTALTNMKTAVTNGISSVVTLMEGIPGKATAAVGDLGKVLWDAGASLLDGLIGGIKSKLGELQNALGGITGLIPDWKGPPAKDAMLLYNSGQLIMGGLIEGIADKEGALQSQLTGVTDAIAGTVGAGLSGGAGVGQLVADLGAQMDQQVAMSALLKEKAGVVVEAVGAALVGFKKLIPLQNLPKDVIEALFNALEGALEFSGQMVSRADEILQNSIEYMDKMRLAALNFANGQAMGGSAPLTAPAGVGGGSSNYTSGGGGGGKTTNVNLNGNIYGMGDFKEAVREAVIYGERIGGL